MEAKASQLYDFRRSRHNHAIDGTHIGSGATVAVRCLTERGICLRKSIHMGGGREGTLPLLREFFATFDYLVAVDISLFPTVRFIPVDTVEVIRLIDRKLIGCGNITRARFYQLFQVPNKAMKHAQTGRVDAQGCRIA